MKKGNVKDALEKVGEGWKGMSAKGRLTAVGAIALMALSVLLATGNVVDRLFGEGSAPSQPEAISEEADLVPKGAEPIPFASEETQLVTSLMAILGNEECAWIAVDDPICAIGFTAEGFDEYTGDIKASHALEFYQIEVTENGRSGVWRIIYDDGTVHDARFALAQDAERGVLTLSSSALPHPLCSLANSAGNCPTSGKQKAPEAVRALRRPSSGAFLEFGLFSPSDEIRARDSHLAHEPRTWLS